MPGKERNHSPLLEIFDITNRKDLKAHCRQSVILGNELTDLIYSCMICAVPIGHVRFHVHHHPPDLALTEKDLSAFGRADVGKINDPHLRKAINKIEATFDQRRLFNGHLFTPLMHLGHWHLFYFDQRDTDTEANHWEHGSHIHLMNWVTHPQVDPIDLERQINGSHRPKLGGGEHIRYERNMGSG